MTTTDLLPSDLSPEQVQALQDTLLTNADLMFRSAQAVFDVENPLHAWTLLILGCEEMGRAIAVHKRRIEMADSADGDTFVNEHFRRLWDDDEQQLDETCAFLTGEPYSFGVNRVRPDETALVAHIIDAWKERSHPTDSPDVQVRFTAHGDPYAPVHYEDIRSFALALRHVSRLEWLLRLGEHIESRKQFLRDHEASEAPRQGSAQDEASHSTDPSGPQPSLMGWKRRTRGSGKIHNRAYAFPHLGPEAEASQREPELWFTAVAAFPLPRDLDQCF